MIVLDTNVVSELMRPMPAGAVLRWTAGQPAAHLFTTALTQAEILSGLALLPDGRRRSEMTVAAEQMFAEDFAGRVLSFDAAAAEEYAVIAVDCRTNGRPVGAFDAAIAAIARSRGAALATRNVVDFQDCGVLVVNPWVD